MKKHQCPCCGYYTYDLPPKDAPFAICPVCFWENDVFCTSDEAPSSANHGLNLVQARTNFKAFGACNREMRPYVRQPKEDEVRGFDA